MKRYYKILGLTLVLSVAGLSAHNLLPLIEDARHEVETNWEAIRAVLVDDNDKVKAANRKQPDVVQKLSNITKAQKKAKDSLICMEESNKADEREREAARNEMAQIDRLFIDIGTILGRIRIIEAVDRLNHNWSNIKRLLISEDGSVDEASFTRQDITALWNNSVEENEEAKKTFTFLEQHGVQKSRSHMHKVSTAFTEIGSFLKKV